jgi:hypothetical protein
MITVEINNFILFAIIKIKVWKIGVHIAYCFGLVGKGEI